MSIFISGIYRRLKLEISLVIPASNFTNVLAYFQGAICLQYSRFENNWPQLDQELYIDKVLGLTNLTNFHPVQVVARVSEPQLQLDENVR